MGTFEEPGSPPGTSGIRGHLVLAAPRRARGRSRARLGGAGAAILQPYRVLPRGRRELDLRLARGTRARGRKDTARRARPVRRTAPTSGRSRRASSTGTRHPSRSTERCGFRIVGVREKARPQARRVARRDSDGAPLSSGRVERPGARPAGGRAALFFVRVCGSSFRFLPHDAAKTRAVGPDRGSSSGSAVARSHRAPSPRRRACFLVDVLVAPARGRPPCRPGTPAP